MIDMGYRRCIARRKPFIKNATKAKRLEWALRYKDWNKVDWGRVIWTDKSAMQNGGQRDIYVT